MDNATTLTAPSASPPPSCLPDCATDHAAEGPLDGQLCTSPPVAVEARNGEHLLVWAGRFTDDSAAETSVSIAHAPDGALPAELSPARARRLAAELVRAAERAEHGDPLPPAL